MTDRYSSLAASDATGRGSQKPSGRRWLRTILATGLLAIPASRLAAQGSPAITANPRSLTFYARAGYAPPAAIPVEVAALTPGSTYTATSNQPWLRVTPTSNATGGVSSVAVQADQASLVAGTYSGTVQFAAPGFIGSSVNVTFHVANPTGTLRKLWMPAVGSDPASVAAGDFNRDGKPDLAVGNWSSSNVTVLLGDGVSGFTAASTPAVESAAASVAVGDFNGDANPDLAVASYNSRSVTVLLGGGNGHFTPVPFPLYAGCGPVSVAVSDFNGDGKQDLAVQNEGGNPNARVNPIVLLGDGTGRFSGATDPAAPCQTHGIDYPASVAVGDFNGDGKLDLASVRTIGDNVVVQLGDGTGGFSAAPGSPFAAGSQPAFVVASDLNGDGKQELAVANRGGGVTVLLGNGAGGFTQAQGSPFTDSVSFRSLAVGDFNGDGYPDLAGTRFGTTYNMTVLLGDGTGELTMPAEGGYFAAGGNPSTPGSMAVGDFNGDGRPDLAVPSFYGSSTVSVLLGNPAITSSALSTTGAVFWYGAPIPLSLTISAQETAFNTPSGAVTFYDGTTLLGTLTQTSGPYTFNAVNLLPGTHTLSARYAGNARSVGSTSNTITIQVRILQGPHR